MRNRSLFSWASRQPAWRADALLDRLVDAARHAGVPTDLAISGRRRHLPATVDLAAYRIVQESLTNVLRHAAS
jgi:signal transduction histidine kinase